MFAITAGLQRAKKVVSNNLELVDFAVGLVNSVLNLQDGPVNFLPEWQVVKLTFFAPCLDKYFCQL